MFLQIHILSILFLIDGPFPSLADGGGIQLENFRQMHLEVNLINQCMANPETGPTGKYESAMRFKFLLDRGQHCNGSIWLCYPGQLDPRKTFGLSVPTAHWAIRNLRNNSIAKMCINTRKECQNFGGDCEMQGTPWHGIQIKIGDDGQVEFNISTGGSYKFPLTNFTLMLHNNAVNDEADPAAFLVDDHDNRDLCIAKDAFPIGGQSKPVVIKIPLQGNEASYTEWKKLDKVGQLGKLWKHPHLFRLSWDMLPKTQLDNQDDDEKMHIWMEHDVNATCKTRVFFLDRMQREADNFIICPDTAEVTKIPLSDQCPGSGWKLIKAAHLADDYGSELVVRVGFLHANLYNKKEYKQQDEEEWIQLRTNLSTSPMMVQRWPKSLEQFIKKFDLGDYRYASVQNDFGLNVSMDQPLEALVLNCSFGKMATLVRRVQGGIDRSKIPTEDEPIYDWSKDFDHVNQCKENQHLLIRWTMEIEKACGNISLGIDGLQTGLLKHWIKQEATTEEEWRSASTIDLIAHRVPFCKFPRAKHEDQKLSNRLKRTKELSKSMISNGYQKT